MTLHTLETLGRPAKTLRRMEVEEVGSNQSTSLRRLTALVAALLLITLATCGGGLAEVTVDCSGSKLMDEFGDKDLREALLRYLASSAEWRLTREGLTVLAHRRGTVHQAYGPQLRWLVRFEPYAYGGGLKLASYSVAMSGDDAARVSLCKARDASETLGSQLYVYSRNGQLWLEISEWNASPERPLTAAALDELERTLRHVIEHKQSILGGQVEKWGLPEGSFVRSEHDSVQVRDGSQRGIYLVSGYVNPAEAGYVTVEARDPDTGELIIHEIDLANSAEYVGYSDDPNQRFFFECELMIVRGGWDKTLPARFEVWFHPTTPVRLAETACEVYGWER